MFIKNKLLRVIQVVWNAIAIVLMLSLGFNTVIQFLHIDILNSLFNVVLYFLLLVNLFMLEGLQVAGLNIRANQLSDSASSCKFSNKKVDGIIAFFTGRFDDFVAGRQILTIASVVVMSNALNSFSIPESHWVILKLAEIEFVNWYLVFIGSSYFGFVCTILIPAWFSQLLPQYLADKNAYWFIQLPCANVVIKLTSLISYIQAGVPAITLSNCLRKKDK